jgi:hypothetical protein
MLIAIAYRMQDDLRSGDLGAAMRSGTAKHGKVLAGGGGMRSACNSKVLFAHRIWCSTGLLLPFHSLLHHPAGDLCLLFHHIRCDMGT